ncbi:hypothetical protein F0562_034279 [Nyssa sinensis]|uniref:Protein DETOXIFICATION n=1 Tax=Nyssa sinensis TaxID=561372 RepID=A0A5J5AKG0_9ASTE|nr:hypothetical protein F0562_034279 [Nyssa sinensis]
MENSKQPLLSTREEDQTPDHSQDVLRPTNSSFASSFIADADDIGPITGVRDFFREFMVESRKLWYLAGPAIFTSLCQYSLGAVTQVFAGHVGTLELAAVSVENSVIAGFSFGVMLGMGSALETLCGQAFGAGQIDMLGVYMQRSWVILNTTCFFSNVFLHLCGAVSETDRPDSRHIGGSWQQSKIMVMAVIAAVALVLHTLFSWLFMLKLGWGMVGAAVVLNVSWWFIVVAQLLYIFSGTCGRAWSGFSWKAFQNLWGFVRLSLASAVMLCLEVWYFMALILFAGYLKNAEVSVDALSICMNILGWAVMVALGCNAAISVRVSNELGAAHPRTAKFSVVVVVYNFISDSTEVKTLVYELTPLLGVCIIINNVQPVLSGVAIGAGWQAFVAYVNIACYYIFGVPLGLLLGYKFNMGVKGIWSGMLAGTVIQTIVLFFITYRTNWNKEASIAGQRIKHWGGEQDAKEDDVEKLIN